LGAREPEALVLGRLPFHTTQMADESRPQRPTSYVSLYATTFLVGVVMISLGPVLDPILADLHIPLSQGGLISVGFAVGMLIGVVALNFLLARVPVKWGLIGASWLQTVALAVSGLLARNLWSLFIAYLFVGLGCVFLNSLPGMWVTSHVKVGTGHAMVVLLLFFAFGMMISPVIIGAALGWGATWRWVFVLEAALSLVLALVLTTRPVSDIPGRENLRWRQLKEVVGFNPRLFTAIVVAGLLYIGAEFILNVWLAKFTIDVFGTSKTLASYVVALFWAGLVIGRLIVIPLTKRVLTSRLLMVGTAVMAIFALGVALSTSLAMSMVMAFICGLGASASYALIVSFSGRFKAWHAGVVYSAMVVASGLGRIIFPYVIGPIAHSLGFRVAIGLAFVLAAVVSLLSLYLHRVSGEGQTAG
jgi:FHS family glucose/mannose:H+ symporter-like MFS transporter